jgi:multidrug efflux system outer membrane protein
LRLTQTYFALRTVESQRALLDRTVDLLREALQLVQARFAGEIASELEVAQAETQLATTEATAISLAQQRATLEHALAVLVGVPAEDFGTAASSVDLSPPVIPAGMPSALLERRPDIGEAEQLMVAANARIGVAQAAFFPRIVLTSAAGFESADIGSLFTWPSRIWSAGPSISLPLFEGGRLTANLQAAQAQYEQTVAAYRQQVLVAFKEVEDALAGLRVLGEQAQAQARAVAAARQTATLANIQYREGLASYINVVDAERSALDTEQAAIQILGQHMTVSVGLIKALGGGWNTGVASLSDKSVS